MSLWSRFTLEIHNPNDFKKTHNKNIVDIIKEICPINLNQKYVETHINSIYQNNTLTIYFRSTEIMGSDLNSFIEDIVKVLKNNNDHSFIIKIDSNYYY